MVMKHLNGFVGYGISNEDALDSCKIISVLKDAYNIRGFKELENRRDELSPWMPKLNTLHIRNVGYIQIEHGYLVCKSISQRTKITGMFEMLYKTFFEYLTMTDIVLCATEFKEFFDANEIITPKFSSYDQVVPEDIFMYDDQITSYVILEQYSIIFYGINKVAIKRNAEELYWACTYNEEEGSAIDTLYYIAYVRGYEGIGDILKGAE